MYCESRSAASVVTAASRAPRSRPRARGDVAARQAQSRTAAVRRMRGRTTPALYSVARRHATPRPLRGCARRGYFARMRLRSRSVRVSALSGLIARPGGACGRQPARRVAGVIAADLVGDRVGTGARPARSASRCRPAASRWPARRTIWSGTATVRRCPRPSSCQAAGVARQAAAGRLPAAVRLHLPRPDPVAQRCRSDARRTRCTAAPSSPRPHRANAAASASCVPGASDPKGNAIGVAGAGNGKICTAKEVWIGAAGRGIGSVGNQQPLSASNAGAQPSAAAPAPAAPAASGVRRRRCRPPRRCCPAAACAWPRRRPAPARRRRRPRSSHRWRRRSRAAGGRRAAGDAVAAGDRADARRRRAGQPRRLRRPRRVPDTPTAARPPTVPPTAPAKAPTPAAKAEQREAAEHGGGWFGCQIAPSQLTPAAGSCVLARRRSASVRRGADDAVTERNPTSERDDMRDDESLAEHRDRTGASGYDACGCSRGRGDGCSRWRRRRSASAVSLTMESSKSDGWRGQAVRRARLRRREGRRARRTI